MAALFNLNFDPFLGDRRDKNCLELIYPLIGCILLFCLRLILIRVVFTRFGIQSRLENTKLLEKTYRKSRKWTQRDITGLSKQLDLSYEEVQQWLKSRLARDGVHKFTNSLWEFCYCFCACSYGVVVFFGEPWLWDFKKCWTEHQAIGYNLWWYFTMSYSWAWSQLFGLIFAVNSNDFYALVVHHVTLVLSMSLAWTTDFYKYAAVSVLTSDFCNVFLEPAKMSKFLKRDKFANRIFGVAVFVWLVVRWFLHPMLILSLFVDAPKILPSLPDYVVYYALRLSGCVFFVLNIFWSYVITRVLIVNFGNRKP